MAKTYVQKTSEKGQVNGYAGLDGTGKVPTAQLPATSVPDATGAVKGIVQLAGDLAGTSASPQIAAGAVVIADLATALKNVTKGVCIYTGGAYPARPAMGSVEFIGPSDPGGLAVDGDTWVLTA